MLVGAAMPAPPAELKDWQADMDGETLMRAQEIKNDKARYDRAVGALREKQRALGKVIGRNGRNGDGGQLLGQGYRRL